MVTLMVRLSHSPLQMHTLELQNPTKGKEQKIKFQNLSLQPQITMILNRISSKVCTKN